MRLAHIEISELHMWPLRRPQYYFNEDTRALQEVQNSLFEGLPHYGLNRSWRYTRSTPVQIHEHGVGELERSVSANLLNQSIQEDDK